MKTMLEAALNEVESITAVGKDRNVARDDHHSEMAEALTKHP